MSRFTINRRFHRALSWATVTAIAFFPLNARAWGNIGGAKSALHPFQMPPACCMGMTQGEMRQCAMPCCHPGFGFNIRLDYSESCCCRIQSQSFPASLGREATAFQLLSASALNGRSEPLIFSDNSPLHPLPENDYAHGPPQFSSALLRAPPH